MPGSVDDEPPVGGDDTSGGAPPLSACQLALERTRAAVHRVLLLSPATASRETVDMTAEPTARVRVTRRGLIGGAAAGAAAAALPATARAARVPGRRADVVIVGAGLAGLAAARKVLAAGRSAIVLEARHRV